MTIRLDDMDEARLLAGMVVDKGRLVQALIELDRSESMATRIIVALSKRPELQAHVASALAPVTPEAAK